ncbi:MAG: double-strand break repair helicase AddA [Sphingomonas bacterium]|uniref:double-strand break repair helicase AddA n=1 Tax=Sphingomonas bacterium TaxID=1895847 RepID=UPI00262E648A|nr:double-strand break repair helicase AddA [Sphingomonas bacterium]MDB5695717.1 double-strand break repair helicase AddA [Sphingomonas bacterium]
MGGSSGSALKPLTSEQAKGSDPTAHVWLSASAGTGKTHVLAARVFRLLLRGVDPSAILCLTFTKAGAAEMAGRISDRLARWVRLSKTELSSDLQALGERGDPSQQAIARTLFARVLDAPGGGLRIQTIHGFCQGLLAAFPVEAGLTPGFRPLEAREEAGLMREALAGMLADAEAQGRTRPEEVIGALSLRLGEGGAEGFLTACARALTALEELPSGVQPWLRRTLELPTGSIDEALAEGCDAIDLDAVHRIVAANRAWGAATGIKRAETAERWLAAEPAGRATSLRALLESVFTKSGAPFKHQAKILAHEPELVELSQQLGEHCLDLLSLVGRAAYADLLADGLEVGRDYARAYATAKRRAGAVDFDDLIQTVVRLFAQPGVGEWVRFKLDQVTEHVLIDEAQDTNMAQWRIVDALAREFFVGRGVHAPSTRTLFTVGDFKQAIFGFQGTDPAYFRWAEERFGKLAADALGDEDWPLHERGLEMHRLSLVNSFRSTKPVLEFVDAAVAAIAEPGLGMFDPIERHASEVAGPGTVTLWPPVIAGGDSDDEESWVDDQVRELATKIARAVHAWTNDPSMLKRDGSRLVPQDVMILVKRRGELASLLVARLYAEGVPVAGVDRLRLNTPLAVQDMLAAVRFVLQPDDDLSLASLLVSPLIGWTQDELMAAAPRETGSLWRHLNRTQPPERLAVLNAMLNRADFATPYQLLEELLSGSLDGRRKLLERLGAEARDPIEELLNAALTFESTTTPSLQRFLDWFDRGEVEIVRDPSAPLDAVRVMTAHGAKGLQAPLVILADACVDPTQTPRSVIQWTHDPDAPPVPVFRPRREERGGPLDAAMDLLAERELKEHWRLFYVAATRAEEQLVIAGSLGPRAKGVPPSASWFAAAAQAMTDLGVPDAPGERVFTGTEPTRAVARRDPVNAVPAIEPPLPDWARRIAPTEARPPRPLAPSSIGEDAVADPPPTPAMRAAAERGRLIHALLERLPAAAPAERQRAADRWLRDTGQVTDAAARQEITQSVCAIIADPRFCDLFGPESLAEAPVTAVVGEGLVVAGTVDRLLVTSDLVRVVDFKTGRRAPATADEIPPYHLRQMAAYVAALQVIFPGRAVEAGLLYTATPVLFDLPAALLARHKPGLPAPK